MGMGMGNLVYDVELVGIVFLRTVTRPGTPYSPLLSNSQLFWGVRVFNDDFTVKSFAG